jgi:hypothetical protein
MNDQERAEAEHTEWARIHADRDARIRRARDAGLSKNRIHVLTGISRVTIDRVLND